MKLQKRDNRSLYTREVFSRPYDNENSFGATYGEHREALEFGSAQYRELQAYAADLGVRSSRRRSTCPAPTSWRSSTCRPTRSRRRTSRNTPLLRHVAQIGKPMILSTGGATIDDVRRGFDTFAEINPDVAILQCTAGYPAEWDELDLRVIATYREMFPEAVVGLSSHDNGIAMAVAGYVLGARIVEKHFTLNRTMSGTDHRFSLEPQGLRKLVRDLDRARSRSATGSRRSTRAKPRRR